MGSPVDLPPVSVAGLQVPAPLVPRIITALRATYPQLTAELDDDASVRAVLKYWVTVTLANHEAAQALAPADDAAQAVLSDYRQKADDAHTKAVQDATAIVDNPPATV